MKPYFLRHGSTSTLLIILLPTHASACLPPPQLWYQTTMFAFVFFCFEAFSNSNVQLVLCRYDGLCCTWRLQFFQSSVLSSLGNFSCKFLFFHFSLSANFFTFFYQHFVCCGFRRLSCDMFTLKYVINANAGGGYTRCGLCKCTDTI